MTWTLPLVSLGAGVISFSSPCCVPLVPGYLSYVSALPISGLGARDARTLTLRASLLFVAGFTVAFTVLGASVGLVGAALSLFYLALLALGEVLSPGAAYIGAAVASSLLVVLYSVAILRSSTRAGIRRAIRQRRAAGRARPSDGEARPFTPPPWGKHAFRSR